MTVSSQVNRVLHNSLHDRIITLIEENNIRGMDFYAELAMTKDLLAGMSMEEITFKYYSKEGDSFVLINEDLDSDYRFKLWKEFKEYTPDEKYNAMSSLVYRIFDPEEEDEGELV